MPIASEPTHATLEELIHKKLETGGMPYPWCNLTRASAVAKANQRIPLLAAV